MSGKSSPAKLARVRFRGGRHPLTSRSAPVYRGERLPHHRYLLVSCLFFGELLEKGIISRSNSATGVIGRSRDESRELHRVSNNT